MICIQCVNFQDKETFPVNLTFELWQVRHYCTLGRQYWYSTQHVLEILGSCVLYKYLVYKNNWQFALQMNLLLGRRPIEPMQTYQDMISSMVEYGMMEKKQ